MRQISVLATMAALVAVVYFSCTPQVEEAPDQVVAPPVMREVSELVNLMFEMEGNMKLVRARLVDDSTFTQLERMNYEAIFTAEASKDVTRDSAFVSHGNAFLKELYLLSNTNAKDSALTCYNDAINACVTCHQSYCPGPVARIKKLRIN